MQRFVFLSFFLLCITSCQQRLVKKNIKKEHLQESVARLLDVPDTPLCVVVNKVVRSEQNPDSIQITGNYGKMPKRDLKKFYIEEMERLGWSLQAEYNGDELLLEFVRPSGKGCIISIRSKQQLVITILNKKEAF